MLHTVAALRCVHRRSQRGCSVGASGLVQKQMSPPALMPPPPPPHPLPACPPPPPHHHHHRAAPQAPVPQPAVSPSPMAVRNPCSSRGAGAWGTTFQGPSRGPREGKRAGEARPRGPAPGRSLALTRLAGLKKLYPAPWRHGTALPSKSCSVSTVVVLGGARPNPASPARIFSTPPTPPPPHSGSCPFPTVAGPKEGGGGCCWFKIDAPASRVPPLQWSGRGGGKQREWAAREQF
jgi:hypothetical protein